MRLLIRFGYILVVVILLTSLMSCSVIGNIPSADNESEAVSSEQSADDSSESSADTTSPETSEVPSVKWQKVLGGSNDDEALSVASTTDGGFIVAGYTESNDGDVENQHGSSDFWIIKHENRMEKNLWRHHG